MTAIKSAVCASICAFDVEFGWYECMKEVADDEHEDGIDVTNDDNGINGIIDAGGISAVTASTVVAVVVNFGDGEFAQSLL